MVAMLILGILAVAALEVPRLVVRGEKAESLAFCALSAVGFVLVVAVIQDWPVPNPTELIRALFRPVSAMLGMRYGNH